MKSSSFISRTMPYMQTDGHILMDGGDKQYVLTIKDLPREEKPREKLVKYGSAYLSVGELLAVVLGVGTKREGILAMSQRLMKEYGDADIVREQDPTKLEKRFGIPLVKACQIVACFELGRRFFETPSPRKLVELRTAGQVFSYVKDMNDLPKECLRGLYLDTHYRLVHDEVISLGTLNSNLVHPREIFRPAVAYAASAVILVHNHPSGIVTPSDADIAITRQIVEAGKIMGIGVLDHIIITKEKFESISVEY